MIQSPKNIKYPTVCEGTLLVSENITKRTTDKDPALRKKFFLILKTG